MSLTLKPGSRLFSAVCATEMIAVRAPTEAVEVTIGGVVPVLSADERDASGSPIEGHDGGVAMGKRYVDDAGAEVLVTKAGKGTLSVGATPLTIKEAKPLPASD